MGRARRPDGHVQGGPNAEGHVRESTPFELRHPERGGFEQRSRGNLDGVSDAVAIGERYCAALAGHDSIIGEQKENTVNQRLPATRFMPTPRLVNETKMAYPFVMGS